MKIMTLIKYEEEDIIPVLLTTLALTYDTMVELLFENAIDVEYADLRDSMTMKEIWPYRWNLLELMNDDFSLVIRQYLWFVEAAMHQISNVYTLDEELVFNSEKYNEMGLEFFYGVISYREYSEEPNVKWEGVQEMDFYLVSVRNLLNSLCTLIINHEVELILAFEKEDFFEVSLEILEKNDHENYLVRLLSNLGNELVKHEEGLPRR